MHSLTIDRQRCCGDGLCVKSCFRECFALDEQGRAFWKEDSPSRCVGCGHCVSVCPRGAIRLDGVGAEDLPEGGMRWSAEESEAFLRSRRAVRLYAARPLDRERLARAVHTASYAPTGTNRREVGFIVMDDPAALNRLRELLAEWMRRYPRWERHVARYEQGDDALLRGAPDVIVVHGPERHGDSAEHPSWLAPQTAAAAASYLELAMHGMGMGTCWSGLIVRGAGEVAAVRELFRLPPGRSIYAAFLAGYPVQRFYRIPFREVPSLVWI
ncbi:nitroreductase family protein [Mailhella massiliensis]|uniref:nitroreductase family protein n=1 Tax=Mailhella massiliensis TaxID=1903261 RepID=UPI0023F1279B|nr:nitroreductase family protein [Mailhella massiliensis]